MTDPKSPSEPPPRMDYWWHPHDSASESRIRGRTGCLLAAAKDVPLATRTLCEIEDKCFPWHYLVERCDFVQKRRAFIKAEDEKTNLLEIRRRHPGHVRVLAFSKPREAKNGAD